VGDTHPWPKMVLNHPLGVRICPYLHPPTPARTNICKNIGLKRSSKYPGWERKLATKEEQSSDFPGRGDKFAK
jgi:hypothetical protein